MYSSKIFFISVLFTIISFEAVSQGFSEPSVTLKGGINPERPLKDSVGTFGSDLLQLNTSIPLLTRYEVNKKPGFFTIRISPSLSRRNYEFSEWNSNHTLYHTRLGLNAIYHSGKNSFLSMFNMLWLGDNQLISQSAPLVSGGLVYSRKTSETFRYFVGASYSFSFGGGIPLPVLGLQTGSVNGHTFQLILPFSLAFASPRGKLLGYRIQLRPDGGLGYFDNSGGEIAGSNDLLLRVRGLKLGGNVKYHLTRQLSFAVDLDVLFRRELSLVNLEERQLSADPLWSRSIENGLMFGLILSYRFGRDVDSGFNDFLNSF